jgi:hypothetical protein
VMAQLAVIVLRLGDSCSGNPDLSGSSAEFPLARQRADSSRHIWHCSIVCTWR